MVHFRPLYKSIQNLPTSHGYIFRTLQHFASVVVIDCQAVSGIRSIYNILQSGFAFCNSCKFFFLLDSYFHGARLIDERNTFLAWFWSWLNPVVQRWYLSSVFHSYVARFYLCIFSASNVLKYSNRTVNVTFGFRKMYRQSCLEILPHSIWSLNSATRFENSQHSALWTSGIWYWARVSSTFW